MSTALQVTSEDFADDPRFANLINAAREFIAERIHTIEQNVYNDYNPEDLASAKREETVIEVEIDLLNRLAQNTPLAQRSIDSQEAALHWLVDNRRPDLSREAAMLELRRAFSHDPALLAKLDTMHRGVNGTNVYTSSGATVVSNQARINGV